MSNIKKRIIAYLMDIILIGLLITLIGMSPINRNYGKAIDLQNEYNANVEKYIDLESDDSLDYENSIKEYTNLTKEYLYESNKLNIYEVIISLVIYLLYFTVLPLYMNGATLGKKIMKLKITSNNGESLKFTQLLLRAIVLYELPISLLTLIAVYTLNVDSFVVILALLNLISFGLSVAVVLSTLVKKDNRGLHDMLGNTKVEAVDNE